MKSPWLGILSLFTLLFLAFPLRAADAPEPIRPKVVILTTYELGEDTGDKPGEFQYWVEREKLVHQLVVPGVSRPLRYNDAGVYAIVTGTCDRSGLAMMALGLDPRFDLTHTYFMMAGIAGVDPADASGGSAAWARWIIDADFAIELDRKDIPSTWPYGILALGAKEPGQAPDPNATWAIKPMAFQLNPKLVAWAYGLTKNVALEDSPGLQKLRAPYQGYPAAQKPPFVLLGDTVGTSRFWHGPIMTKWANDWAKLHTNGDANFVMTACEDQSIAYALSLLQQAGRVDNRRYLVLRTASNYCMPPDGASSVESGTAELGAYLPALEAAYRVGSPVVHEIVTHWPKYRETMPGS